MKGGYIMEERGMVEIKVRTKHFPNLFYNYLSCYSLVSICIDGYLKIYFILVAILFREESSYFKITDPIYIFREKVKCKPIGCWMQKERARTRKTQRRINIKLGIENLS